MGTTREALEAALAAEPESVALHSAYADLLIEEGDPRGEYIRLELALEDVGLTREEREVLLIRSSDLFSIHERLWLRPLYRLVHSDVPDPADNLVTVRWKRGWLDTVVAKSLNRLVIGSLVRCPMNRLLRSCEIIEYVSPVDDDLVRSLQLLKRIPCRELIFTGYTTVGDRLLQYLDQYLLKYRAIALKLNRCGITDDGALMIANSPHIRNLKSLNLDNNYLSTIGIAALAEVGFAIGQQRENPAWDDDLFNLR